MLTDRRNVSDLYIRFSFGNFHFPICCINHSISFEKMFPDYIRNDNLKNFNANSYVWATVGKRTKHFRKCKCFLLNFYFCIIHSQIYVSAYFTHFNSADY